MKIHLIVLLISFYTVFSAIHVPAQSNDTTPDASATPGAASSLAEFISPEDVAVDGNGNVYVADGSSPVIRKITPDGMVTTFAGLAKNPGSVDGKGSAARFSYTHGIAVDGKGNVYVADSDNNTIRKITPDGIVTTLAGTAGTTGGSDGAGSAAQFKRPWSVAVDGSGNVYVADAGNNTIRKITADGIVTTLAGSAGETASIDCDGKGSAARFKYPAGVAVDGSGNVYVSDSGNNTIRKITPDGIVTTLAGSASEGTTGSTDGTGNAARFNSPGGVTVDGNGNVYVADSGNHTIRKITPDGVVTTLAGLPGHSGRSDGKGSVARFGLTSPDGVAVDGSGNLYVADSSNWIIRKITPGGVVTTLAGRFPGSNDGKAR
jgi:sugar lactone lactonase YvrE